MAWAAALAGGVLSYMGAREQNSASRGAGTVNMSTTHVPYRGSEIYRDAGAAQAYRLMFGQEPPPAAPGGNWSPRPVGSGNGTNPGMQEQAAAPGGQAAQGGGRKKPGRGGGGGAGKPAGPSFQGQSQQTAAAIDNASRVAAGMEDSDVVRAAQGYTSGTLSGEDQNPYRAETAAMLRNQNDPALQRYLDMLMGSDTGLPGGKAAQGDGLTSGQGFGSGGSGPRPRGVRAGESLTYTPGGDLAPGGSANPQGPIGVNKDLRSILDGNDSPAAQAMRERIKRQADEAYNSQAQQLRLRAAGSGMYGGTPYQNAEAQALGRYGAGLADAYAAQDYNLYGQALGLGTQYDIAAQDRAASERNASLAASTSAGNVADELASRERLARLDALGGAVGMSLQQGQFRTSGMGALGADFATDQRAALGLAGDVNGLGQAGYLNAGGLGVASDNARNAWQSSQNSLAAARASAGVQRAQLDFDKYRYADNRDWDHLARYTDILNGNYAAYGTTNEVGVDRRAQSPSYTNAGYQAIAGAAAGYSMAQGTR